MDLPDTVRTVHESTDHTPSLNWPIQRVRADGQQRLDDCIVREEPLEIVVNGQSLAVLMRMPGQEKELAAGFCISEGYVRQASDILLIQHCGLGHPAPDGSESEIGSRNRVEVRVAQEGFTPPDRPDVVRLIRSGCGAADVSALSDGLPMVNHNLRTSASVLLRLGQVMRDSQVVYREVGGTHAAALFDGMGQLEVIAEDIGRHNAVDKVIGHCLLWNRPLHDKILLTSGRASYEMVTKAIRVGIPIVASMSAPTSLGVELAQDRSLTLVGYLRGGRMNVYTHGDRITE